jgi:transposase
MTTIRVKFKDAIDSSIELIKSNPDIKLAVKLKAIAALKNNNIKKVSEVFCVCDDTIKFWVKSFANKGIDGLIAKVKNPRKPKLSDCHKQKIEYWIKKNPNLTLKEISIRIKNSFNIDISLPGLWKNIKKMNFSYITARSKHYKQNKVRFDEFKKNFCQKS